MSVQQFSSRCLGLLNRRHDSGRGVVSTSKRHFTVQRHELQRCFAARISSSSKHLRCHLGRCRSWISRPQIDSIAKWRRTMVIDAGSMNLRSAPLVTSGYERLVGTWLLATGGMLFGMICIGGYTRLSGSGLSMTKWKFQGTLLPSGQEAWEREFEIYKETPEYLKLHDGLMDLDGFKKIYFVEWFHRMWGRFTGAIFGGPLLYFLAQRALTPRLIGQLSGLFVLGASQAFIGWWMVKSGFTDPKAHMPLSDNEVPRVSAYRLTTHLAAALTIYGGVIWTAFSILNPIPPSVLTGPATLNAHRILQRSVFGASLIIITTILSGGFVAGNDAGMAFNNWPKMTEDRWIPDEVRNAYSFKQPRMFTEDTATVQFNHRLLAYSSVAASLTVAAVSHHLRSQLSHPAYFCCSRLLPAAVIGQLSLGICTLLNCVPIEYGVAHQAGGVGVLTVLLLALSRLRIP